MNEARDKGGLLGGKKASLQVVAAASSTTKSRVFFSGAERERNLCQIQIMHAVRRFSWWLTLTWLAVALSSVKAAMVSRFPLNFRHNHKMAFRIFYQQGVSTKIFAFFSLFSSSQSSTNVNSTESSQVQIKTFSKTRENSLMFHAK